MLRICSSVGGGGVVLLGDSTDPYDTLAVRASLGAVLSQYLLLRAGEVLAQHGTLPAPVALQLSNAVLIAVGLGLCWTLERRGPGVVR